jgi:hypothetical protein
MPEALSFAESRRQYQEKTEEIINDWAGLVFFYKTCHNGSTKVTSKQLCTVQWVESKGKRHKSKKKVKKTCKENYKENYNNYFKKSKQIHNSPYYYYCFGLFVVDSAHCTAQC